MAPFSLLTFFIPLHEELVVKRFLNSLIAKVGLVAASLLVASTSHAAIDTTAGLASLVDAGSAMSFVGGAILGLAGVSLGYRWVKATFF